MQRDEDEAGRGEQAARNHQITLPHMSNEKRNRERIENAAHGEDGDQESGD